MTAITAAQMFFTRGSTRPNPFDIAPATRALIGMAGAGVTAISAVALVRLGAGYAPAHSGLKELAVLIHVASVVPAVPLGAWLMLARKGTPRHKSLGKVWVLLMVLTALSALFIRTANGGDFSFIHVFVPLTPARRVENDQHCAPGRYCRAHSRSDPDVSGRADHLRAVCLSARPDDGDGLVRESGTQRFRPARAAVPLHGDR